EVPLRDSSIDGQVELALAALAAPVTEQVAKFGFVSVFLRLHRLLKTGWGRPHRTTDGPCWDLSHPCRKSASSWVSRLVWTCHPASLLPYREIPSGSRHPSIRRHCAAR